MATETGAAIVIVRHLNKSGGGRSLYRGGGSIGIVGAARSGLLIGSDPKDATRRVLAVTKSNLSAPCPSLGFLMDQGDAQAAPRIVWTGTSDLTADELVAEHSHRPSKVDGAVDFLTDLLVDGPMPADTVAAAAEKAGISLASLRRASALASVTKTRVGFGPGGSWAWSLDDGEVVDGGSIEPIPVEQAAPIAGDVSTYGASA